jgi:hypothetical protein
MPKHVDLAYDNFRTLKAEIEQAQYSLATEDDTRLQLVDRVLIEVLGWPRSSIKCAAATGNGFADYLLSVDDKPRLVVEAKKAGRILVGSRAAGAKTYKAGGPALQEAQDGLRQAQRYCATSGCIFSALTTGIEWIGFWAIREGKSPFEGTAIVYPDWNAIESDFARFFELFSPVGASQALFKSWIQEAEGLSIKHSEQLRTTVPPNTLKLLAKSQFASDLDSVFKSFFSSMAGENDREMLAKCFVESKESREADNALQKITRNLVNRIDLLSSAKGEELEDHLRAAVQTNKGEFVLIVGNKGAGKSTFIDRFFDLVIPSDLAQRCVVLRADLADSTGETETVNSWLIRTLTEELEKVAFTEGMPSYADLQATFFHEYRRWQTGEFKWLYDTDKPGFKKRFGEYVFSVRNSDPELYLHRLLQNVASLRQQMPCLVFDNTDHYKQEFQEHVFLFAQSIYRKTFTFIICPITDRTIWQLSKQGPLQSYETTTFYLPIPPIKEVLEKRIAFIREKVDDDSPSQQQADYFLSKGIRLSVRDIRAFAVIVEEVLLNTDYVSRIVGSLANFEVRRSLQISKRVLTSAYLSIDEVTKAYLLGRNISIPNHKIVRALICCDYNYFSQASSDFVLNLYEIDGQEISTPFTRLSILRLLQDRESASREKEMSYMRVDEIQDYFEPAQIARAAVTKHLQKLLDYRLVEPYVPTDMFARDDSRIAIAPSGRIHLELALSNETYATQMALTTPLRDNELSNDLRSTWNHVGRFGREQWLSLVEQFFRYCDEQDVQLASLPEHKRYEGQVDLRRSLRRRWIERRLPSQAPDSSFTQVEE